VLATQLPVDVAYTRKAAAAHSMRPIETFWTTSKGLIRRVRGRDGRLHTSLIALEPSSGIEARVDGGLAESCLLRSESAPPHPRSRGERVRLVDLFCGSGGLTLGLQEAGRALGLRVDVAFAVDFDPSATAVFGHNFPSARVATEDVTNLLDGELGSPPSSSERQLQKLLGKTDVLVGGPPCQGHSDLNNRTRRSDPKNSLYLRMARATEVLSPEHVLIENVPGAINDQNQVIQRSVAALEALGYRVSSGVVDTSVIGVAQRRRRLVIAASRSRFVDIEATKHAHVTEPRGVRWAIGDLRGRRTRGVLDVAAQSAQATRRRIDYLFDHDLYDLPNSERPPCHRDGAHSYNSIYGRLSWAAPAQTITTGFYSMCMGRYVHPSERRTITAHEAARLQFLPDYFDFSPVLKRSHLAKLIGNAVPMKLGYVFGLEFLR
jgi:DNA (cytosine-5)-methyltransferase 1